MENSLKVNKLENRLDKSEKKDRLCYLLVNQEHFNVSCYKYMIGLNNAGLLFIFRI